MMYYKKGFECTILPKVFLSVMILAFLAGGRGVVYILTTSQEN